MSRKDTKDSDNTLDYYDESLSISAVGKLLDRSNLKAEKEAQPSGQKTEKYITSGPKAPLVPPRVENEKAKTIRRTRLDPGEIKPAMIIDDDADMVKPEKLERVKYEAREPEIRTRERIAKIETEGAGTVDRRNDNKWNIRPAQDTEDFEDDEIDLEQGIKKELAQRAQKQPEKRKSYRDFDEDYEAPIKRIREHEQRNRVNRAELEPEEETRDTHIQSSRRISLDESRERPTARTYKEERDIEESPQPARRISLDPQERQARRRALMGDIEKDEDVSMDTRPQQGQQRQKQQGSMKPQKIQPQSQSSQLKQQGGKSYSLEQKGISVTQKKSPYKSGGGSFKARAGSIPPIRIMAIVMLIATLGIFAFLVTRLNSLQSEIDYLQASAEFAEGLDVDSIIAERDDLAGQVSFLQGRLEDLETALTGGSLNFIDNDPFPDEDYVPVSGTGTGAITSGPVVHVVQPGEHLSAISLIHFESVQYVQAIRDANNLAVDAIIDIGQELIIPLP